MPYKLTHLCTFINCDDDFSFEMGLISRGGFLGMGALFVGFRGGVMGSDSNNFLRLEARRANCTFGGTPSSLHAYMQSNSKIFICLNIFRVTGRKHI